MSNWTPSRLQCSIYDLLPADLAIAQRQFELLETTYARDPETAFGFANTSLSKANGVQQQEAVKTYATVAWLQSRVCHTPRSVACADKQSRLEALKMSLVTNPQSRASQQPSSAAAPTLLLTVKKTSSPASRQLYKDPLARFSLSGLVLVQSCHREIQPILPWAP